MSTPELLSAALGGDRGAVRALVASLAPVVQARVARTLLRRRAREVPRDLRQEVLDMSQEVFAVLFERDARVLRSWDPARGLSLANFVGLVAEREVASILRSGTRSPFVADDLRSESALMEELPAPEAPDADITSRQLLERLLDTLRTRLSPLGLQMFHLLYAEERSVDEVCAAMAMRPDAVYAWRSRLSRLALEIRRELEGAGMSESGGAGPRPMDEGTKHENDGGTGP